MIKDKDIAKKLIDVLDQCSHDMNESIRLVQQDCNEEEFKSYRKAAGFVMGYIYTDVLAPIYLAHPELEPEELKS